MEFNAESLFLQNIDEYILDEEKIVTYRWLSRSLEIDAAHARQLLVTWLTSRKSKHPETELLITYLVIGSKKDGGSLVTVVRENDLHELLEKLNIGATKSLYSIQKGIELSSIKSLGAVEPTFQPCSGAVKCPTSAIVVRVAKPILEIEQPVVKSSKIPFKATPFEKKPDMFSNVKKKNDANTEKQPENNTKKNKTSPPEKINLAKATKTKGKSGIANFFSRNPSKSIPTETTDKIETPPKKTDFFKVQSTKKDVKTAEIVKLSADIKSAEMSDSPNKIIETRSPKSKSQVEVNMKALMSDNKENNTVKIQSDDEIPNTPTILASNNKFKTKKTTLKKNKRQRNVSDDGKNAKRRKRIVLQSDSSDEDMFAESDTEKKPKSIFDEDDSPSPPAVSTPSVITKHHKKKFVDKTYTDEDGFIITCKEQVDCSESEEEVVQLPPAAMKKAVVPSPKVYTNSTKQSNLMSFFKKK